MKANIIVGAISFFTGIVVAIAIGYVAAFAFMTMQFKAESKARQIEHVSYEASGRVRSLRVSSHSWQELYALVQDESGIVIRAEDLPDYSTISFSLKNTSWEEILLRHHPEGFEAKKMPDGTFLVRQKAITD
jgi:hypothetical protein